MTASNIVLCPNYWREFPFGDWRIVVPGGTCFDCQSVLVTPEQRYAGFVKGMRLTDTPTLQRWAANDRESTRRDVARQVLNERADALVKKNRKIVIDNQR